jgi:ABC-2 type transport system ATP-binding protein
MADYAVVSEGLSKRFGRKKALDSVDIHVPCGSIYGLVGPNGAGKTTLIRCLLGLLNATEGRLHVLGHDVRKESAAVRRRVGHVAALQPLWDWMKVRELARFMSGCYPRWNERLVADLLTRTGIDPEARLQALSRGQRALAALAVQVGHEPDLLILDEALTGLDPLARREVLRGVIEAMHDDSRTVLIAGQDLSDMERICDHVGVLVGGRLIAEGPLDVLKERMKRLRVSHAPEADLALPAGALSVTRGARETSFVLGDGGEEVLRDLQARGLEAEADGLCLEEIVVSLAQSAPAGVRGESGTLGGYRSCDHCS